MWGVQVFEINRCSNYGIDLYGTDALTSVTVGCHQCTMRHVDSFLVGFSFLVCWPCETTVHSCSPFLFIHSSTVITVVSFYYYILSFFPPVCVFSSISASLVLSRFFSLFFLKDSYYRSHFVSVRPKRLNTEKKFSASSLWYFVMLLFI